jgi:hypothetical protein
MKPDAPVTKHFINERKLILRQRAAGRHKKFFTMDSLTWRDGSEKMSASYAGQEQYQKKIEPRQPA